MDEWGDAMSGRAVVRATCSARVRRALSWACALGLVAGVALAGAESEPGTGTTPDPMLAEMGAGPFAQYCASCHGASGRGDGPVRPALSTAPADLTRIAARRDGEFPRGEIARIIDGRFSIDAHGTREMPVWGDRFGERVAEPGLSEEVSRGMIAVLVEYLASIQVH